MEGILAWIKVFGPNNNVDNFCKAVRTLINALITKKERYGLASLCIGGGEASAMIIENYDSV